MGSLEPNVRIFCFGTFEVFRGETRVSDSEWQSRQVKNLLKYVVLQRHRPVSRDELIEVLWPDLSPERAAANLWSAVYVLRRCLEPGLKKGNESRFILCRRNNYYRFNTEAPYWLDVEEFEERFRLLEEAPHGSLEGTIQRLEESIGVYRGHLLEEDHDEGWVAPLRLRYRESYLEILETLARLYVGKGNQEDRALRFLRLAVEVDSIRESAHFQIMRLYAATGRRVLALRQFDSCRRALHEHLGIDPSPEMESYYRALLDGEVVS